MLLASGTTLYFFGDDMNGIDKIAAVSAGAHGDSHLSDNESTSALRNKPKSAEINAENKNSDSEEGSTKLSLSSKSADEIKKEQQLKQEEVKKTDYTLEMTGIPLYHGRLVSVVKYPNGEKVTVDAFSGLKVSAPELSFNVTQPATVIKGILNDKMTNIAAKEGESIKSRHEEKE
ncbi:Mu-like prophage FluMu N-terminal domain-containing protein [Phytobacter sp. AG2a]